jgi:hypothetical protein
MKEIGPNGFKTGYLPNGDFVEWTEEDGEICPMILRRNDEAILEAYKKLWEKVWWHRHQQHNEDMLAGRAEWKPLSEEHEARLQKKYRQMNLPVMTEYEFELALGQMSALAWVTGAEWYESFDT